MIKHLVLSGGGPTGFLSYGALKYLNINNFWNINEIESIYGTSIGAYLGVLIALNLNWKFIDNYFIETRWDKLLNLKPFNIIDAFSSKGLIQPNFIRDSLEPLFYKKGLDIDINMEEFYKQNNIDLHFFTTDMNSPNFEKIDLSHKTHPKLSLIDAVEMSTAYPILFKPIFFEKSCYIDGGLLNNLPLNDCIENKSASENEILVLKNDWSDNNLTVTKKSSIVDFFLIFILKLIEQVGTEKNQTLVPNTISFDMNKIDNFKKGQYRSWIKCVTDKNNRKYLINTGENTASKFINRLN